MGNGTHDSHSFLLFTWITEHICCNICSSWTQKGGSEHLCVWQEDTYLSERAVHWVTTSPVYTLGRRPVRLNSALTDFYLYSSLSGLVRSRDMMSLGEICVRTVSCKNPFAMKSSLFRLSTLYIK